MLPHSSLPTSATQAKDKNYMLLGHSLARLSRAVGQTADLSELLKVNLDAMKVLAATHAAQFMTAAAELVPEPEAEEESESSPQ
ncbi:hypothetical protein PHLGIDRAFT_119794 [Phlebiopsis gigantea 11061_1 CR5-6]|uniref:Uncharacterized protein n=1 Tax=Phlebiopsis gigantea (strain 11061_1 CR5-6) TaxID=745531 RepID=A0A0C3S5A7_PHLG1|nr:hypothetical protein PHLGIDRAFT_119794 [Phlebiopsis gigantea 11061_1 CR5-6]